MSASLSRDDHFFEQPTAERRIDLPQYMIVLEEKQPAYYESEFLASEGIVVSQRKLLLPLSEDGVPVSMVLGSISTGWT